MPSKSEGKYAGEYLASQGNGEISRDTITLLAGTLYQPGDVLGIITASGKATLIAPAAADGSQVAALINYARQDATGGDVTKAPVTAREAEVNEAEINYNGANAGQIATIKTQLAARNIIVRPGK